MLTKIVVKRAPDLSSLAVDILPSLVPVERQETELREVATQLALAGLRLQYLTRAMNEDAAMLNSTIMAFGATLMRRKAEEEECVIVEKEDAITPKQPKCEGDKVTLATTTEETKDNPTNTEKLE